MTGTIKKILGLHEVATGVFYANDALVTATKELIGFLKTSAANSPLKRARLCAHPTSDAVQHDMIIVSHYSTYVAPHRHFGRSETMLILEGKARAPLFNGQGNVENVLKLGSSESGRIFFYRMPETKFHSLIIETEWLVFIESTIGPFDQTQSEDAIWAPPASKFTEGKIYLDKCLSDFESAN